MDKIDDVRSYLRQLGRVFNLDGFLKHDGAPECAPEYYTRCRWIYDFLHSRAGALHMALNYDRRFRADGFREQPRMVAAELKAAKDVRRVIEVGCGKGYNTAILARQRREIQFNAIDITPAHIDIAAHRNRHLRNALFRVDDYEDLWYADDSFDFAFAIECLCHARSLPQVLAEVWRVVRPGGRFVITDGFREVGFDGMAPPLQVASQLVELSMAVERFWQIDVFLRTAEATGWRVVDVRDLGHAILPNLRRLQRIAKWYMRNERLAKKLTRALPSHLVRHAITGLLGAATLEGGAQGYYAVVLEKVDPAA